MFPIVEYASFAAYFERYPDGLVSQLRALSDMAMKCLGDGMIHLRLDEAGAGEALRREFDAKPGKYQGIECKLMLSEVDKLSDHLTERLAWFGMSCDPPNPDRYEEFGFHESLWSFKFEAEPVAWGVSSGPSLQMGFGLEHLSEPQCERIPAIAREFARIASMVGRVTFGLCDVADVREIARGETYSTMSVGWLNFQRQLNQRLWFRAGRARAHKSRGVFWGNLMGASVVQRLGGANKLAEEYLALEGKRSEELCTIYPDGSIFITLCEHIGEFRHPYHRLMPWTLNRAAWLYERLAAAGLLCGMP